MTTEIIKNYENTIQNTKLRNFTEQIYKQGLNIKKSFARVAAILVKIDESKCYEQDGFTSVQDYAEKVLGWKQANTYAMLKVGRDYIDGKTYESVLPHADGNDYSTSQLQALLPLKSVDVAKELAESETITPNMTVKQIKDVVKAYNHKDDTEANTEEVSEDSESKEIIDVTPFTVLHTIQIVKDADGVTFFMVDGEEQRYADAVADLLYSAE